MCEYCNRIANNKKIIDIDDEDNTHAEIVIQKKSWGPMLYVEIEGEDLDGYKPSQFFQINFCPMCRKEIKRGRTRRAMEQWLRDALAEEQGYIICPLRFGTYTICDENCEKCEDYIDFMEALKEREEEER